MQTESGTIKMLKVEEPDDGKGEKKQNILKDKLASSLRENMCLFPSDENQEKLISEGRSYRLPPKS